MKFKSDKQRRFVMNMFSRGSNRFALYKSNAERSKINDKFGKVRSTIYPQVDFRMDFDDPVMEREVMILPGKDIENEEEFAGLEWLISHGLMQEDVYGVYDSNGKGIEIRKFYQPDDIFRCDGLPPLRIEGDAFQNILKHELAHHIDNELSDDEYYKNRKYFEDMARIPKEKEVIKEFLKNGDNKASFREYADKDNSVKNPDGEYVRSIYDIPRSKLDGNKKTIRDALERYEFAKALKKATTLSYDELMQYV